MTMEYEPAAEEYPPYKAEEYPPYKAEEYPAYKEARSVYYSNPRHYDAGQPKRAELLDEAKALVMGDRNNQYGPPTQDFTRTAQALNAMGYRGPEGKALLAHDVALLVIVVKISRLMWAPGKQDSWADIAGYAACGYECASEEESWA